MVNAVSRRRRALALGGGALVCGLGACAALEEAAPGPQQAPAADPTRLLTPWLSLTGGWRVEPLQFPMAARPSGPRVNFVQPTGVAARNDVVLVADPGARTLWRLERTRDAIAPLAAFTGGSADTGASLQLDPDFSAWIALPAEHMVVQYDGRGRLVRRWVDLADAPRPVAVAVPEDRSEVLVGDGATARVIVFDPLGRPLGVLGGRAPTVLQSITAMALGPAGLYVLDRLGQQVVVLDRRGLPVAVIGENQLVQPRALAVDRSGRVFVSDDADQRIKVFRDAQLLASAGGTGNAPGRFGRIESLAIDGNLLYVADSGNARVQVLMVAPVALEQPGGTR